MRSSPESSKARSGDRTALIVAAYGKRGEAVTDDGERLPCFAATRGLQFVCGDRVRLGPGTGEASIVAIEPRRGLLARQTDRPGRPEPVAANLTHLLVLLAPRPVPDFELADRYLAAARLAGAIGALGWNKSDLEPADRPELAAYARAGYAVFPLAARTGGGLATLRAWVGHGTVLVAGQSGVGKSSLLNALVPEAAEATGELSASSGEGRHTTTATRMFRVGSGWLADSPGVRDFVPAIPDPRQVASGFAEIAALAGNCRFADCSHDEEPGCAVKAALATGGVDARRYASYRQLLRLAATAAGRRYRR